MHIRVICVIQNGTKQEESLISDIYQDKFSFIYLFSTWKLQLNKEICFKQQTELIFFPIKNMGCIIISNYIININN